MSHRAIQYLWFFGIMQEYCRRLLFLQDASTYSTFSWLFIASLEANIYRLLFHLSQSILRY